MLIPTKVLIMNMRLFPLLLRTCSGTCACASTFPFAFATPDRSEEVPKPLVMSPFSFTIPKELVEELEADKIHETDTKWKTFNSHVRLPGTKNTRRNMSTPLDSGSSL